MMGAASINGITIGYDDAGAGENVLVLVHGHPFDRSMWRPQVEKISRQADFAQASAVRRPGYGGQVVGQGRKDAKIAEGHWCSLSFVVVR